MFFLAGDTVWLLRRDQICLVQKNKAGISQVRELIKYKNVRNDALYEKEYLQGQYAAVPFLQQFEYPFIHEDESEAR